MPQVGFEPTIPASERPQTHACTGFDRPLGLQEIEASRVLGSRNMKMARLPDYAPAAFILPRKYPWYSFLLEAESNPGP
jgi:hypothetical protein